MAKTWEDLPLLPAMASSVLLSRHYYRMLNSLINNAFSIISRSFSRQSSLGGLSLNFRRLEEDYKPWFHNRWRQSNDYILTACVWLFLKLMWTLKRNFLQQVVYRKEINECNILQPMVDRYRTFCKRLLCSPTIGTSPVSIKYLTIQLMNSISIPGSWIISPTCFIPGFIFYPGISQDRNYKTYCLLLHTVIG